MSKRGELYCIKNCCSNYKDSKCVIGKCPKIAKCKGFKGGRSNGI